MIAENYDLTIEMFRNWSLHHCLRFPIQPLSVWECICINRLFALQTLNTRSLCTDVESSSLHFKWCFKCYYYAHHFQKLSRILSSKFIMTTPQFQVEITHQYFHFIEFRMTLWLKLSAHIHSLLKIVKNLS